jgi:aspartate racemase
MIDMNTQVPDRSAAIRDGREAEVVAALSESVTRLQDAGCRLLAMPCNTAHFFLPWVAEAFRVPFVHMVREVRAICRRDLAGRRVALLATTGTLRTELYQQTLGGEVRLLVPDSHTAQRVHEVVTLVKAGKKRRARDRLKPILDELVGAGAEGFIVGCTEIPLALPPTTVPVIDSVRVLAAACVRRAAELR